MMWTIMTLTFLFANNCTFEFSGSGDKVTYVCKNKTYSYSYDSKNDQIISDDTSIKREFKEWRSRTVKMKESLKNQKDTFKCR